MTIPTIYVSGRRESYFRVVLKSSRKIPARPGHLLEMQVQGLWPCLTLTLNKTKDFNNIKMLICIKDPRLNGSVEHVHFL